MNTKDKTVVKALGMCGGGIPSLPANVDVKDGRIVRVRPLHYDEYIPREDEDAYHWKIEKDGHVFDPGFKSLVPPFSLSYKKRTYSKNRIPYPLKRVDWDPEGERNTQNRGISKYERISWDEAISLVAHEIIRVQSTYGHNSILCQGDGHGEGKIYEGGHGCMMPMLDATGGCTKQARQPDSWEGWYWGAKWMWGMEPIGKNTRANNCFRDTTENGDAILFWSCDPEATPWGFNGMISGRMCNWFNEIGVKSIYICPDLNYGAAVHADKWIPVLPNTDSALQLAIAYVWITEDLYDKEYIATHAVGFDWFEHQVLGHDDGIPKTPKWAEGKCGVPSFVIKALARYWASHKVSITHGDGGSMIRSAFAHEPGRLEVALLGMQAAGKPGANQWAFIDWGIFGVDGTYPVPPPEYTSALSGAYNGWLMDVGPSFIPKTLIPQAILEPPVDWYGRCICFHVTDDQLEHFSFPAKGESGLHMIWSDAPCWSTCWNNGNLFIDALRHESIECYVVQHPWMENDTTFADIILPVSTIMECEDIGNDTQTGVVSSIWLSEQACEPVGESKTDYAVVCEVARELEKSGGIYEGLYETYTQGLDREGFYRRGIAMSGVPEDAGLSYESLMENKLWASPTKKDWKDMPSGMIEFYEDPESNPLETPSGKLEYYSVRLAENFSDDQIRGPYPRWIEKGDGHDDRWDSGRAEKFPFLIISNHPRWRVHAQHNDIPWTREIETCKIKGPDGYLYEPVWVNPLDAAKLDLKQGDICELYNESGSVLGAVHITERVRTGVVLQDHGATVDALSGGSGGIDRGGANNLICPAPTTSKNAVGEVTSGYLVGLRKADIDALKARYPEPFERGYRTESGLIYDSYFEGGAR